MVLASQSEVACICTLSAFYHVAKQHSKGVSTQATAFAPWPSARFVFIVRHSVFTTPLQKLCRMKIWGFFSKTKKHCRCKYNQNNINYKGYDISNSWHSNRFVILRKYLNPVILYACQRGTYGLISWRPIFTKIYVTFHFFMDNQSSLLTLILHEIPCIFSYC